MLAVMGPAASTYRNGTEAMPTHPRYTRIPIARPVNTMPPAVDVVVLNSRGADNPWFQNTLASVQAQVYGNTGLVVVDNNDHGLSIGEGWNLAVRESTAERVLFVGDDDYLAIDAVQHMSQTMDWLHSMEQTQDVVLVTTGCTMVDENGRPMAKMDQHHTGMFLRQHLVENPFREDLAKLVDTAAHNSITLKEQFSKRRLQWASGYYYGYMYRQHPFMASGQKVAYQQQPGKLHRV